MEWPYLPLASSFLSDSLPPGPTRQEEKKHGFFYERAVGAVGAEQGERRRPCGLVGARRCGLAESGRAQAEEQGQRSSPARTRARPGVAGLAAMAGMGVRGHGRGACGRRERGQRPEEGLAGLPVEGVARWAGGRSSLVWAGGAAIVGARASRGRRKDRTVFCVTSGSGEFTKLSLVEHPLRRSTKMVNPAFRSTILVNSDLVDLECLGNF